MPKAEMVKRNKAIHPQSRTASQLARNSRREGKADLKLKEKTIKLEGIAEKLKWFQDNLEEGKAAYTKEEACQLTESYLGRFSEELEQIEIVNTMKGRSGFQHASRKHIINTSIEKERREYEAQGLEIPDVVNGKHLKAFREWGGEIRALPSLKLRLIKPMTEAKSGESSKSTTDDKNTEKGDAKMCVESDK